MPDTIYRDQFETLGEYLVAVINTNTDAPRDPRLEYSASAGLEGGVTDLPDRRHHQPLHPLAGDA